MKINLACVLLLSLGTLLPAQEGADNTSSAFAWTTRIKGSTFYLTGSVHAGKSAYYPLPDHLMNIFDASDALIMEISDDFDSLETKMLQLAEPDRLPEEQYFRNHLDSATMASILRVMDREEFLKYDQYQGWFLNMILSGSRLKLAGFDPDLGIDKYFQKRARTEHKRILGLDRLEDQLALFKFDLPYDVQVQLLTRVASLMEMQSEAERPLVEAYFSWNEKRFEELFLGMYDLDNPNVQNVYNTVFTARNLKWVDEIERIAGEEPGTYMIMVGSGHYFGPNNVLELLDKKGYKVEHMK